MARLKSEFLFDEVFLIIDYSQSLADMIASGKYDWVNPYITQENFPLTGEGIIELKAELIYFGKTMSTDNVLKELDCGGLRPATLPELLSFGAQYPEKQREFPVVAFGSVWEDLSAHRDVPCLYEDDAKRCLSLNWFGGDWHDFFRFLAFRK